jgi:ComF family protein
MLEDACPTCSGPAADGDCPVCSGRHWFLDANVTLAAYRGVMKNIIREMKFGKVRKLHAILASLAGDEISRRGISADLLTWVPMNGKKLHDRGFNQSELIARALAKRTGTPCRRLLIERRGSGTQRRLGIRDRFINILDRYEAAAAARIDGLTVLLVDDIYTTGATINECARRLKNAGARRVISVTMARADIKRPEK